MSSKGMTIGWVEEVSFPELGLDNIEAKVDTGAYSGALHCTGIKVVRRGLSRKRVLRYLPDGRKDLARETDKFYETHVRSALGHGQKRYIIETEIVLKGKKYPIMIGLSDRSDMKRPMLLGRRFLRENNLLVDVRINAEYDDEGESIR